MTDVRTNDELVAATAASLRWITIARVAVELLLLVAMVVLARLIPPSAFGVFAVVVIVQELSISFPNEGVGSALVQREKVTREHLQAALALSLAASFVLILLTLVAAAVVVEPLLGAETATLVAVASSSFVLGAILAVPMAVLRRRLDFRRLSMVELTYTFLRGALAVALAVMFGLDASALVLGGLLAVAAVVVLALVLAPVPPPRWHPDAVRDLLPYGSPAALACLAWTGFRNGDYVIVGARLGSLQAGFYWRGFQLAVEYQRKISSVMAQVAFPVLARTASIDDMFLLRRRMVQLLSVIVFPLLVVLVLLAPELIPWVFGEQWQPAVVPTQILAGAGAATVLTDAVGSALMAAGRAGALLGYGVAHFGVYIVAIFIASGHGLTAVATASVVVHGVFLVVAYRVLLVGHQERALRCLWNDVEAAAVGCLGLVAVAGPVTWALWRLGAPPVLHIAVVGPVATLAYLAALRMWFRDAWHDLGAMAQRILPQGPLHSVLRRIVPPRRAAA